MELQSCRHGGSRFDSWHLVQFVPRTLQMGRLRSSQVADSDLIATVYPVSACVITIDDIASYTKMAGYLGVVGVGGSHPPGPTTLDGDPAAARSAGCTQIHGGLHADRSQARTRLPQQVRFSIMHVDPLETCGDAALIPAGDMADRGDGRAQVRRAGASIESGLAMSGVACLEVSRAIATAAPARHGHPPAVADSSLRDRTQEPALGSRSLAARMRHPVHPRVDGARGRCWKRLA
jgi:hypothetical protein